jgi:uncharacterized protein (DUF433 family)
MIPAELHEVLCEDPKVMSGAVCFVGTRVPVQALLDTLANGLPVSDFLEGFPDVTEEQAMRIVRWEQAQARQALGLERAA